jgi:hypothetical protein
MVCYLSLLMVLTHETYCPVLALHSLLTFIPRSVQADSDVSFISFNSHHTLHTCLISLYNHLAFQCIQSIGAQDSSFNQDEMFLVGPWATSFTLASPKNLQLHNASIISPKRQKLYSGCWSTLDTIVLTVSNHMGWPLLWSRRTPSRSSLWHFDYQLKTVTPLVPMLNSNDCCSPFLKMNQYMTGGIPENCIITSGWRLIGQYVVSIALFHTPSLIVVDPYLISSHCISEGHLLLQGTVHMVCADFIVHILLHVC